MNVNQLQKEYEILHEILANESHETKLSSQLLSRKEFIIDISKQTHDYFQKISSERTRIEWLQRGKYSYNSVVV